jgi:hypothetical protein
MDIVIIAFIGVTLTSWVTFKNLKDGTQGDDK